MNAANQFQPSTEAINQVPPDRVDEIVKRFQAAGAYVLAQRCTDGTYRVEAKFFVPNYPASGSAVFSPVSASN